MSLRSLESSICFELRRVLRNGKIRVKDIREWNTGPVVPQDGEIVVALDSPKVNVAIFASLDRRRPS